MSTVSYSIDELLSIYELGRLYFEMGYFAPAERIFSGLCAVDSGQTPARIGLGLVKLECGAVNDALGHFRLALQDNFYPFQAKVSLLAGFLAAKELSRAQSILLQIERELDGLPQVDPDLRALCQGLFLTARAKTN